ncbi:MAG: tryptophanase [Saprospiraceae bacterium]|jgi:tryptophanase
MKNLFLISFLALTFTFTACNEKATSGSSHPEFMLDQAFDLGLGKTMQLKGSDFTLNFAEVTQDSRCPEGVNCIRAGEVIFTLNGQSVTKEARKEVKAMIGDYKVTFLSVSPYPKNGVQMDRTSYVVNMMVSN